MDQQQQQGEEESCCVPPGFRFHPTEEELVGYYLARKVASQKIDLDIIQEVDLYRIEPWDLQERCKQQHGGGEQPTEWYFFSYKDRKYPSGTRTNRATAAGFWKATGRDKPVVSSSCRWVIIGMRKTLVFYRGRAPNGSKTEWIMHEYRLQQAATPDHEAAAGGWVVCRAFQKPIPNNQIIRPPPFFPSSYAAAGAGYYDYDHHHLSGAARLRLDSGDHHQFLISSSSPLLHHHPVHVPAAAAGAGNSLLYSDDDLLLESKNKHLLFSSILPQLVESPSTASSGIACCSSDAALQTISSSYEHDDGQLIIQGAGAGAGAGGQAAAAGVIDWNFLDTLLSTTSQLHEPSIGP